MKKRDPDALRVAVIKGAGFKPAPAKFIVLTYTLSLKQFRCLFSQM